MLNKVATKHAMNKLEIQLMITASVMITRFIIKAIHYVVLVVIPVKAMIVPYLERCYLLEAV